LRAAAEVRADVFVQLSVAVSLDGYIDDASPKRLVLSSAEDLEDVRALRSRFDAVLVGAQTLRRDDPALHGAKARVVVTKSGDLDPALRFFDGSAPSIVVTTDSEVLDPREILERLTAHGIDSVFIEGGTRVLTAFLASGTFDALRLAVAPFFVGEADAPRVTTPARFVDDASHRLALRGVRMLGDVAVLDYARRA